MNMLIPWRRNQGSEFASLDNFFSDMEALTNRFFNDDFFNLGLTKAYSKLPKVNVRETEDSFIVDAFVPGLEKSDIRLEIKDNVLVLQYSKSDKCCEDNEGLIFREISQRSFERTIPFPKEIVSDKIKASLDKGILNIIVPKVKAGPKPNWGKIIEIE